MVGFPTAVFDFVKIKALLVCLLTSGELLLQGCVFSSFAYKVLEEEVD